jgi:bifunctional DNA-binding transcriptional regulator/antitoxin component of YhaV-PrlF toxin-antitoxin module
MAPPNRVDSSGRIWQYGPVAPFWPIIGSMPSEPQEPTSYRARIDGAGRVTIPIDLRRLHRIQSGDEVVLVHRKHGLEIKTHQEVIEEAQRLFRQALPRSRSLSKELIAERRREVQSDG